VLESSELGHLLPASNRREPATDGAGER
jgi:hypothetical protein